MVEIEGSVKPDSHSFTRSTKRRTSVSVEELSANRMDDEDDDNRSCVSVSDLRRRRIYESRYGRPYPKKAKKKVQFWTKDPWKKDNASSGGISPLMEKFNRQWISSPQQQTSRPTTIGDRKKIVSYKDTAEIAPRNIWASEELHDGVEKKNADGVKGNSTTNGNVFDESGNILSTPTKVSIQGKDAVMTNAETTPTMVTSASPGILETPKTPARRVTPPSSIQNGTPATDVSVNSASSACQSVSPLSSLAGFESRTSSFIQACYTASGALTANTSCGGPSKETESSGPPQLLNLVSKDHVHLESHLKLQHVMHGNEKDMLKLSIDAYQESTFDGIVESLYGNRMVKTLIVTRVEGDLGNYKTTMEMNCFWEAMRCLPELETLLLFNLRQDVLMDLGVALQNNKTIKQLKLHLHEGTVHPPLLDAIPTMANLTHLQLDVHESFDVGSLLKCPNLEELRIMSPKNDGVMESHQVQGLIEKMKYHSRLQSLELQPSICSSSFVSLAQSLHSNRVLKSLSVKVVGEDGDEDGMLKNSIVVNEIVQLVKVNTNLTKLWNHGHETLHLSKEAIATSEVLETLQNNHAIQFFKIFNESDPLFWIAKEEILKRNRENENNPYSLPSFFSEYMACGSLTGCYENINIGIPNKWTSTCIDLQERNCNKASLLRFAQAPAASNPCRHPF